MTDPAHVVRQLDDHESRIRILERDKETIIRVDKLDHRISKVEIDFATFNGKQIAAFSLVTFVIQLLFQFFGKS